LILYKFVNLWRYWASAFLDIFPNWVIAPGLAFRKPVVVEIKNLKSFFDAPLKVIEFETGSPAPQLKGCLIDILLTPEDLLERHVKLQKMPEKHFTKAMEVNLQKSSPVPVEQLTFRQGERKMENGSSITTQYVIKNDKLELIEQTMTALGLRLRTITTKASNYAFLDRSAEYDHPKRMWLLVNLIAVFAFCGWLGLTKSNQLSALQNANATLTMQIAELQHIAVKRSREVSSQKDAAILARKTATELNIGQNRTTLLEALSGFLKDEVWISEMSIKNANVSLGGFSTLDIASLVSELKGEDWVADARLKSAISGARNSKSKRFQIQLKLNMPNKKAQKQ